MGEGPFGGTVRSAHLERTVPGRAERSWLPFVGLGFVALLFLGFASPWLASGFGETHDGRNGSVWATASRAIREDGVVDSRFGGAPRDSPRYANHPPLIIGETTAAELVGGEHRIVTRAPAWVGSLVALALVTWLLLDAGMSRLAAVSGVAVSFGSAMFLVYGSMLDTPVTSLPFALGVLAAWHRALRGRPWHPAVLGVAAGLAVLAGWQSTTLLGVCAVASVAAVPRQRFPPTQLMAMVVGGGIGLAVTLSWVRWVYGSVGGLFDTASDRRASLSLATSVSTQFGYLVDLAPWALAVGGMGLVAAVWRRSTRWLAIVTTTSVVGYGLVFSEAAEIHDYWSFAVLIPLAIGSAALAQAVLDHASDGSRRAAVLLVVAVPLVGVVPTLTRPSDAEDDLRFGLRTPHLTAEADRLRSNGGPALAYLDGTVRLNTWIAYETGRPPLVLEDRAALRALAADDPAFPVLVLVDERNQAALDRVAIAVEGPYALVPALEADRLVDP